MTTIRERIKCFLSSVTSRRLAVLVGVVLMLPSLGTGLALDDYFHILRLRPEPGIEGIEYRPLDIFAFAQGDAEQIRALVDEGVFGWWADPSVRLSFWRPISSLSHYLDSLLWPDRPALMHGQNLLWFAALLAIVSALLRRFEPRTWVAGLALWLYAVDDAHGWTVGWVAHRNALVAAVLALPALLCHQHLRRRGWQPGAWLGPLFLALGLLAGESAIAVTAYLFAFAVTLDSGPWKARLGCLWPYAAVVVGWRLLYSGLGYGAFASGVYVDPAREPIRFLVQMAEHLPPILHGQLGPLTSDLWIFVSSSARPWIWTGMVLTLGLVAALFAATMRRDPRARFWALGMVLAAIPVCSTFPSDRLLLLVGLGGAGLISCLLSELMAPGTSRRGRARRFPLLVWVRMSCCAALVAVHLVLAPFLAPFRAQIARHMDLMYQAVDRTVPKTEEITSQTLVSINGPIEILLSYLAVARQARGEPRPVAVRMLASAVFELEVTRLAADALRIRRHRGHLRLRLEQMLRGPSRRLAAGEIVEISGLTVEVVSLTADGWPSELELRFDVPLEDPSLHWVRWDRFGFVPYAPPAVGETEFLPPIDPLDLLPRLPNGRR